MTNLAALATQAIGRGETEPQELPDASPAVRKLFIVLHGSYGTLFTSKFSTGELDSKGKDKGIRGAMRVWSAALARYPDDVVFSAMGQLRDAHPKFPPNLPDFESLCLAALPRKTYAQEQNLPALPAPTLAPATKVEIQSRNDGLDWARTLIARHAAGDKIRSGPLSMARNALAH